MPVSDRRTFLKGVATAGALGLAGLAGCAGGGGSGGGGGSADSLSIGVVTDTSGPYSHLGNSVIRGLKLGLAQALDADTSGLADSNTVEGSGIAVDIVAEDSQLSADTGRQKARKLIQNDDVDILQGSVSSAVASAVQDVATDASTPMFVDTAAATAITGEDCNRYTFRTSQTTYQDALAGGRYAANNLGDSFYFVGADYSWGHDSVEQWRTVIENNGGSGMGSSFASPGTEDYTPYLQQAEESGADGIVVALTGTDGITFSRDLNDFGTDFGVTATGVTTVPWMQQVGEAATGFSGIPKYFWTFPDNDTNDWIIEQYRQQWDTVPSIFTAGAHAAGYAIAQGMQASGSAEADPLIEQWHGMTVEQTARGDGAYRIRECDHQAEFPMYLGHFEPTSGGDMAVEPVLDETYDAGSSIRACGETGCSGIEL
jgi:branched-chain amino acid transport system substrate-binding protein